MKPFTIAIDGPAAAGKGTLARKLAAHYDFAYLDTGGLYRAVALTLIRNAEPDPNESKAAFTAQQLSVSMLHDSELRSEACGKLASRIASMPKVREALKEFQVNFAANPPEGKAGSVIDGRDIGTVICPDAPCKIYIIADAKIRAKRRWLELSERGDERPYQDILQDLLARDHQDQERAVAPLKPAKDALVLNTTQMDIETVFKKAVELVDSKRK